MRRLHFLSLLVAGLAPRISSRPVVTGVQVVLGLAETQPVNTTSTGAGTGGRRKAGTGGSVLLKKKYRPSAAHGLFKNHVNEPFLCQHRFQVLIAVSGGICFSAIFYYLITFCNYVLGPKLCLT